MVTIHHSIHCVIFTMYIVRWMQMMKNICLIVPLNIVNCTWKWQYNKSLFSNFVSTAQKERIGRKKFHYSISHTYRTEYKSKSNKEKWGNSFKGFACSVLFEILIDVGKIAWLGSRITWQVQQEWINEGYFLKWLRYQDIEHIVCSIFFVSPLLYVYSSFLLYSMCTLGNRLLKDIDISQCNKHPNSDLTKIFCPDDICDEYFRGKLTHTKYLKNDIIVFQLNTSFRIHPVTL